MKISTKSVERGLSAHNVGKQKLKNHQCNEGYGRLNGLIAQNGLIGDSCQINLVQEELIAVQDQLIIGLAEKYYKY